jgi:hypothetical protein
VPRRTWILAIAGVLALLAGCGGDDTPTVDRSDVKSVFAAFTTASNAQDWQTMCSFISSREKAELEKAKPSGCAAYYSFLSGKYGTAIKTDFRIESLKVHGRSAVLGDSSGQTTYFTNEDGKWLIDRVAPVGTSDTATARYVRSLAGARKSVVSVSCKKGARLYRCAVAYKSGKCEEWVYDHSGNDRGRVWHSDTSRCSRS